MAVPQPKMSMPADRNAELPVFQGLDAGLTSASTMPVHAMQQLLAVKFSGVPDPSGSELSVPAKFSVVFYAGLAAWGALAFAAFAVSRIW